MQKFEKSIFCSLSEHNYTKLSGWPNEQQIYTFFNNAKQNYTTRHRRLQNLLLMSDPHETQTVEMTQRNNLSKLVYNTENWMIPFVILANMIVQTILRTIAPSTIMSTIRREDVEFVQEIIRTSHTAIASVTRLQPDEHTQDHLSYKSVGVPPVTG